MSTTFRHRLPIVMAYGTAILAGVFVAVASRALHWTDGTILTVAIAVATLLGLLGVPLIVVPAAAWRHLEVETRDKATEPGRPDPPIDHHARRIRDVDARFNYATTAQLQLVHPSGMTNTRSRLVLADVMEQDRYEIAATDEQVAGAMSPGQTPINETMIMIRLERVQDDQRNSGLFLIPLSHG